MGGNNENRERGTEDHDNLLVSATTMLNTANGMIEPSSEQIEEVDQTLQELRRTLRSVRVLADYLEQHPGALIRGKRGEPQ